MDCLAIWRRPCGADCGHAKPHMDAACFLRLKSNNYGRRIHVTHV